VGTFTDDGAGGKFTLRRSLPEALPYDSFDVIFRNGAVALSGTLCVPRSPERHAAVVILQGSGGESRWGTNRFIADQFARSGIAALVYDKRGSGVSTREYYQPGLSPKQHTPWLQRLQGFMGIPIYADPSIFYANQAQNDGTFKAISSLYQEEGIDDLTPAPENNELLGMERILQRWMNLDRQEPTLKILCPERSRDIAKPQFGVHNDGCPNLLWELRRARRAESTPNQLFTKNPTEKIIDKDNHLRDSLKYLLLAMPNRAEKSFEMKAAEAIAPLSANGEHTAAYFKYLRMKVEAERSNSEYLQMEPQGKGRHRRIHIGRPRIRRY
jgi:hypothetical protein